MTPPSATEVNRANRKILPRQIRALRRSRNWTQAEFGRRLGVSQPLISMYENGDDGALDLERLRMIAALFDMELHVELKMKGEPGGNGNAG